jgi:hypothetical protein
MKRIALLFTLMLSLSLSAHSQSSKQSNSRFTIQLADSLFFVQAWKNAIPVYEAVLKQAAGNSLAFNRLGYCYQNIGDLEKAMTNYNRSLENSASTGLQATVHSRMARVYALKKENDNAFQSLGKALAAGYSNVNELTTHADFEKIRSDKRFDSILKSANENAMPCLTQQNLRQFDFWVGEWDVYPNGANVLVGKSKIEVASGGCMVLENWTAVGGPPNVGKSMNYVNPATGKWEQLWIGSGGITVNNPQKFVNGEYKDGAMRFDFEQVNPQGQKQIGRFIFFNEGPNQVRQFNEVSNDGGKTWTTVYDFVYKRTK